MSAASARAGADLERLLADVEGDGATRRRVEALNRLDRALAYELETPPPVTEVRRSSTGTMPLLTAEAFELARQVYYLHHGSMRDCARAILAAGLQGELDTDDPVTVISERLKTWWHREQWPKRPTRVTILLRDARDGGLYRGERMCAGVGTGNGPLARGRPCTQTALRDSDYCFQHDPRPEYAERRRQIGERFVYARLRDLVDVGPLREWLICQQRRLLAEARAAGAAHPNQRGGRLLADWLGVDQSLLGRVIDGHQTTTRTLSMSAGRIRAATAVKYLERSGTSFRDIYGYDPPAARDLTPVTCPDCGGRMSAGSKRCRGCWDATRTRCVYVNLRGERCRVPTAHESGHCYKCRRILDRRTQGRTRRRGGPRRNRSSVSIPMLMLAADAYLQTPSFRGVARRMWELNAAGCRDVFGSPSGLESALAKAFRRQGWTASPGGRRRRPRHEALLAVGEGLAELENRHGAVELPATPQAASAIGGAIIPIEPFRQWLAARYAEAGSFRRLAERVAIADATISQWVRRCGRRGGQTTVRRATVEGALELWGAGETIDDLYGSGL